MLLIMTSVSVLVMACGYLIPPRAFGLEHVSVALASKAFQYTILPIAQDRGYLKEEGIDLKIVYM